jgi:NAD(P)-dependent dehydrogenase (short-subunit alcohol dehydrogenase family)
MGQLNDNDTGQRKHLSQGTTLSRNKLFPTKKRVMHKPKQKSMQRLAGKVAIITGASRGIGAATARFFAREGAAVVLAARDEQALQSISEEIQVGDGRALAVPTDVGDPDSVEELIQRTVETYGQLDIAFNNAAGGGGRPKPLADIPIEGYDRALQISLRGIFLSMKYEIPAMLDSGGGVIVNMSSTAGLDAVPGKAEYVASKHGVIGLSKTAALDYARQNLRVNALAPGPILTHRLKDAPEQARERFRVTVPMRRIGQPEEVAATVTWLCSDEAAFITGATIVIDGGQLVGIR